MDRRASRCSFRTVLLLSALLYGGLCAYAFAPHTCPPAPSLHVKGRRASWQNAFHSQRHRRKQRASKLQGSDLTASVSVESRLFPTGSEKVLRGVLLESNLEFVIVREDRRRGGRAGQKGDSQKRAQSGGASHKFLVALEVLGGSVMESDGEEGITHLMEHIMADRLQGVRGSSPSVSACVTPRCSLFSMVGSSFDRDFVSGEGGMERALLSLRNILGDSKVDVEVLERERQRVLSEISCQSSFFEAGSGRLSEKMHQENVIPRKMPVGRKECVDSFSVEQMEEFHRKNITPDKSRVYVVGDFEDTEGVRQLLEKTFQGLRVSPASDERKRTVSGIPFDLQSNNVRSRPFSPGGGHLFFSPQSSSDPHKHEEEKQREETGVRASKTDALFLPWGQRGNLRCRAVIKRPLPSPENEQGQKDRAKEGARRVAEALIERRLQRAGFGSCLQGKGGSSPQGGSGGLYRRGKVSKTRCSLWQADEIELGCRTLSFQLETSVDEMDRVSEICVAELRRLAEGNHFGEEELESAREAALETWNSELRNRVGNLDFSLDACRAAIACGTPLESLDDRWVRVERSVRAASLDDVAASLREFAGWVPQVFRSGGGDANLLVVWGGEGEAEGSGSSAGGTGDGARLLQVLQEASRAPVESLPFPSPIPSRLLESPPSSALSSDFVRLGLEKEGRETLKDGGMTEEGRLYEEQIGWTTGWRGSTSVGLRLREMSNKVKVNFVDVVRKGRGKGAVEKEPDWRVDFTLAGGSLLEGLEGVEKGSLSAGAVALESEGSILGLSRSFVSQVLEKAGASLECECREDVFSLRVTVDGSGRGDGGVGGLEVALQFVCSVLALGAAGGEKENEIPHLVFDDASLRRAAETLEAPRGDFEIVRSLANVGSGLLRQASGGGTEKVGGITPDGIRRVLKAQMNEEVEISVVRGDGARDVEWVVVEDLLLKTAGRVPRSLSECLVTDTKAVRKCIEVRGDDDNDSGVVDETQVTLGVGMPWPNRWGVLPEGESLGSLIEKHELGDGGGFGALLSRQVQDAVRVAARDGLGSVLSGGGVGLDRREVRWRHPLFGFLVTLLLTFLFSEKVDRDMKKRPLAYLHGVDTAASHNVVWGNVLYSFAVCEGKKQDEAVDFLREELRRLRAGELDLVEADVKKSFFLSGDSFGPQDILPGIQLKALPFHSLRSFRDFEALLDAVTSEDLLLGLKAISRVTGQRTLICRQPGPSTSLEQGSEKKQQTDEDEGWKGSLSASQVGHLSLDDFAGDERDPSAAGGLFVMRDQFRRD